MVLSDDQAKAVAESAKLGTELIKVGEGAGSYFARIVAGIPENLVGLTVGDWLEHKRRRNLAKLEAITAQYLEGIDQGRITEPSPSIVLPLLQASVDESDEALQQLWAALLARSIVDGRESARRSYIVKLQQLDVQDVKVLMSSYKFLHKIVSSPGEKSEYEIDKEMEIFVETPRNLNHVTEHIWEYFHLYEAWEWMRSASGLSVREFEMSVFRLSELNLLAVKKNEDQFAFLPTALGIGLIRACSPPNGNLGQ